MPKGVEGHLSTALRAAAEAALYDCLLENSGTPFDFYTLPEMCQTLAACLPVRALRLYQQAIEEKQTDRLIQPVAACMERLLADQYGSGPRSPALCRFLARRLAGNLETVLAGVAIYPESPRGLIGTYEVEVERVTYQRRQRGPRWVGGWHLRLRLCLGPACPAVIETWQSPQFLGFFAREVGFSRRPPLVYEHPAQWYGLCMLAVCVPTATPIGIEVRCTRLLAACRGEEDAELRSRGRPLLAHNRALLRQRGRSTFVCPYRFNHPCHECPVGREDPDRTGRSCVAACRQASLQARLCPACSKQGWFDPLVEATTCVACQERPRRDSEH